MVGVGKLAVDILGGEAAVVARHGLEILYPFLILPLTVANLHLDCPPWGLPSSSAELQVAVCTCLHLTSCFSQTFWWGSFEHFFWVLSGFIVPCLEQVCGRSPHRCGGTCVLPQPVQASTEGRLALPRCIWPCPCSSALTWSFPPPHCKCCSHSDAVPRLCLAGCFCDGDC